MYFVFILGQNKTQKVADYDWGIKIVGPWAVQWRYLYQPTRKISGFKQV